MSEEKRIAEELDRRLAEHDGAGCRGWPRAHVRDKLFQAFYTTKSGGMGIGLSVSVRSSKAWWVVCRRTE